MLARYWMHNGMITVNQEKMSKSLNNFFTIREALVRFHREAIRLFLLSTQYRNPVDYSDTSLEESEAGLERLYQAVAQAEKFIARDKSPRGIQVRELLEQIPAERLMKERPWSRLEAPWEVPTARLSLAERELLELTEQVQQRLDEAMDDDFNTARALGHLFELARAIGRFVTVQPKVSAGATPVLAAAQSVLVGFSRDVLGLLSVTPAAFQEDLNIRRLQGRDVTPEAIDAQIAERREARASKDWARSDRIRDQLADQGIVLEDSPEGTLWKVTSRIDIAKNS